MDIKTSMCVAMAGKFDSFKFSSEIESRVRIVCEEREECTK